jgi:trehalose 6-phosphate phosphatase
MIAMVKPIARPMSGEHKLAPGDFPAARICLFLDIDGTLVNFADAPSAVCLSPSVIETLPLLHDALDGALAVVSGRPLAEIDRLLQPLHLAAAGLHGIERRDAAGRIHLPEVDPGALLGVRQRLEPFVAGHAGLLLEDKGRSLAVHYRMAPQLRDEVWVAMTRAGSGLAPAYKLLEGDMVLEIKPADRDKASAVEDFMREQPFRGRVPVFVGDDVTDYDGFSAVRRHAGITVAVGPRVTAQWYLADPEAVHAWLMRIVNQEPVRAG